MHWDLGGSVSLRVSLRNRERKYPTACTLHGGDSRLFPSSFDTSPVDSTSARHPYSLHVGGGGAIQRCCLQVGPGSSVCFQRLPVQIPSCFLGFQDQSSLSTVEVHTVFQGHDPERTQDLPSSVIGNITRCSRSHARVCCGGAYMMAIFPYG